jgi:hypothetical protein
MAKTNLKKVIFKCLSERGRVPPPPIPPIPFKTQQDFAKDISKKRIDLHWIAFFLRHQLVDLGLNTRLPNHWASQIS